MKHSLKIGIVLLCIVTVSLAFALRGSRIDNDHSKPIKKELLRDYTTPYHEPSRQFHVLFVEDPSSDWGGPATHPDPVWDSVLTELLGAGNFGWFGPTQAPSEDGPDLATLQQYELVIWNSYDYWWDDTAALTDPDLANLGDYFAGGGKVWLLGHDALWTGVPMWWMDTYFHLSGATQDYIFGDSAINIHGLAEINCFSMEALSDYAGNPFFPDELEPDTSVGCHAVVEDTDSNKVVGIFYPGFGEWQSSFWAIDVRDSTRSLYWTTVVNMVTGMLNAFGIYPGVEEIPYRIPTQGLHFNVRPVPLVQSATISFTIPITADVKLKVFNTLGQHITTLIDDYKHAGSYNVTWNGRDTKGVDVPNGIYFVRLTCGKSTYTANIVVVK